MTNTQLYLAIGVPIAVNILFNGLLLGIMWQSLDRRITREIDLLRGELLRMEDVIDARLKHLEGHA